MERRGQSKLTGKPNCSPANPLISNDLSIQLRHRSKSSNSKFSPASLPPPGRLSGLFYKDSVISPLLLLLFVLLVFVALRSGWDFFSPFEDSSEKYSFYHRILHQKLPDAHYSVRAPTPRKTHHKFPRVIGCYFESTNSESFLGVETIDPDVVRLYSFGSMARPDITRDAVRRQSDLENSHDYRQGKTDSFETDQCVAQYEWQKSSKPSCNLLLEQDMISFPITNKAEETIHLIANGFWRDVWKVAARDDKVVLKTMRYEHDFEERNYDRHRRDAVAMERLTSSKYVMDIFGYCGNSGLFEFADGGSVEDFLWFNGDGHEWSPKEKLIVAYQLASGLAAVHNSDKEGRPSIAHVDITPSQFVYVSEKKIFKINDFNRCRFIRENENTGELCPYYVGNNPGTFRSPEEYAYEPQTEKVDVYSLGNIYYSILTGLWPFQKDPVTTSQKKIVDGITPPIDHSVLNSTNPFDQALLRATFQCWNRDPKERASARQVQHFIGGVLRSLQVPEVDRTKPGSG